MSDTTTQRRQLILNRIYHETKHQDYLIDAAKVISQYVIDTGGDIEDAEWATQEFYRHTNECGYGGGEPDYVRAVRSTCFAVMAAQGEPSNLAAE